MDRVHVTMKPAELARVCTTLIGPDWQRPLARALGPRHPLGFRKAIDDRLVRRWAAGEKPVPRWVRGALLAIAEEAILDQRLRLAAMEAVQRELGLSVHAETVDTGFDVMDVDEGVALIVVEA